VWLSHLFFGRFCCSGLILLFGLAFASFSGVDGLMFIVEIDEIFPEMVPLVLFLEVFLGVLIWDGQHFVVELLQLLTCVFNLGFDFV
jgi:hypothetical protein